MARSSYDYKVKEVKGKKVLLIEDLDQPGYKSVTNNIEEVVFEICRKEKLDGASILIVYKDSEGSWDGWDHRNKDFVVLNASSGDEAVAGYIKRK